MPLGRKLRIVYRVGLGAWLLVSCLLAVWALTTDTWPVMSAVVVSYIAAMTFGGLVAGLQRALVRRADRAFGRASISAPVEEARGLYDELAASSPRWTRSLSARIALSNLLLREERFAEARDVLAAITAHELPQRIRWQHLDNRAVATAKAGDPALAIPLAKHALSCAPADAPSEDVALIRATLGFAYVLAGRCNDAVPVLEQALAQSPPGDHRASCAFYLGEAFTALGRPEEGMSAYRRAVAEAPESSAGQRARAKLDLATPYRM